MTQASPKDKRPVPAERDDEAMRLLREGRAAWLERRFERARLLMRLDRKGAYIFEGGSTVAQVTSLMGYDGEADEKDLLLGYAIEERDAIDGAELMEMLREKQITYAKACSLGVIARAQYRHRV